MIDFTRLLPGPMAAMCLTDLGADVIKLETTPHGDYSRHMGGDEHSLTPAFIALNQNKRSCVVDHRGTDGQSVVHDLVRSADVFLESARPGALTPFRLDAKALRDINPRLVYCSVSAYGDSGPFANWPAHGYNIEANAGLVRTSIDDDGALRLPEYSTFVANLSTGYHAAMAIAASLVRASRTGQGAHLAVAAFDAGVAFDPTSAVQALNGIDPDIGIGTRDTPKYAAYMTADGKQLLLATLESKYWIRLCELIGRPDLAVKHRHDLASDWGADYPELYDELSDIFATRTASEWLAAVATSPLPISPIDAPGSVVQGEQFAARGLTRTTTSLSGGVITTMRSPVIVDSMRLGGDGRCAEFGEDTNAVLAEIGYTQAQIRSLQDAGAIHQR